MVVVLFCRRIITKCIKIIIYTEKSSMAQSAKQPHKKCPDSKLIVFHGWYRKEVIMKYTEIYVQTIRNC